MLSAAVIYLTLRIKFGPRLRGLSYDWLDTAIVKIEARLGLPVWTVLLSLILLAAACLYVRPDTQCRYLGFWYAKLAEAPFAFEPASSIGYRLLTPVISYVLGLRGKLIIITNLLIAASLIGSVYYYFRSTAFRAGDAFFAALAITYSLVTLTTIHCGGYCDSLTYLLIFLMYWLRSRRVLFYAFFLLGLLNRESVAFLIPWFVLLRVLEIPDKKKAIVELLIGFGVTGGVYMLFRTWIGMHVEPGYSLAYYLKPLLRDPFYRIRHTVSYHPLGLFSVFKLLWVIPMLAMVSFWRRKDSKNLLAFALLTLCTYLQLFIAQDSSRMLTLGFMVMPIGLLHLFQTNEFGMRRWLGWLFLFNLVVPQAYTAANIIEIWQPLWRYLLTPFLQ